jgi:hypothetical protein
VTLIYRISRNLFAIKTTVATTSKVVYITSPVQYTHNLYQVSCSVGKTVMKITQFEFNSVYVTERFNFNKLNEAEGKGQYCVEISNRFAALENLDAEVDINRAWETITENINISAKESLGYYELKKHKPWFDKGCSKLLDQRKQAKLQ